MSAVLEKARGAAAYARSEFDLADFSDNSAAHFVRQIYGDEWEMQMARLRAFRSLEDDWDGEGSPAPGPELTDSAIILAQSLQKQGDEPPDRVVAGVNGTIYFEWYGPEGYYEIEVHSPTEAEWRWVQDGSDRIGSLRQSSDGECERLNGKVTVTGRHRDEERGRPHHG